MTERKWATIRLDAGDYVIPKNDRSGLYRIRRVEGEGWEVTEGPVPEVVQDFFDTALWHTVSQCHATKRAAIDSITWE